MSVIRFLNVKEGDCTWIKHLSGHSTVIDVCNANKVEEVSESYTDSSENKGGNHKRKDHPTNPIEYFKENGLDTIFRFILTHPDMDHMDGIKDLFEEFKVTNFWDTDNNKEMEEYQDWGRYKKEDWDYYQEIRKSVDNPKVLHLYDGAKGAFYNQDSNETDGGDGLYILSPSKELVEKANESEAYNECSYVILYKTENGKKLIFAGDSGENAWDYILEKYKEEVSDIDILFAPHHGRKTGGNDKYLDVLKPKLTLFGNAESKYLDYSSWNNRNLKYYTNNQADNVIIDTNGEEIKVYITYEVFAKKENPDTFYNEEYNAWYVTSI